MTSLPCGIQPGVYTTACQRASAKLDSTFDAGLSRQPVYPRQQRTRFLLVSCPEVVSLPTSMLYQADIPLGVDLRWSRPAPGLRARDMLTSEVDLGSSAQKSVTRPLKLQSPPLPHLSGSFFGPPSSPVFGFCSPSNSGGAPRRSAGLSAGAAGAAVACVLAAEGGGCAGAADSVGPSVADRCRRSNSACSAAGRRGGDGCEGKLDASRTGDRETGRGPGGRRAAWFRSRETGRGAGD